MTSNSFLRVSGACLIALTAVALLRADQASNLFKAGQKAEQAKNYDLAYQDFRKAADLHPDRYDYLLSARRAQFEASVNHIHLGEQLRDQKKYTEAESEFKQALAIDPSNTIAQQELKQIEDILHPPPPQPGSTVTASGEDALDQRLADAAAPADLGPVSDTPIDLVLSNDSRIAYENLCTLAHLNVIFDSEFHSQHVTLDLHHTTLLEALRVLDLEANAFYTVVTPNTIYVATDSTQKRAELEEMVVKTFYLQNLTKPADLTEIANTIRQIMPSTATTKVQPVASAMAIVMRDTPDRVALAQKIIDDLDKAQPEVVVDVQVLSVNRDLARDLGLLPPNSTTISLATTTTNTTNATTGQTSSVTNNPTLTQLEHLNGTDFTATINSATLNAMLSDANTKTIQEPQLRAVQGAQAQLQIGQRIPIATGSFQPGIGGVGINPLVNTQFQYQPVGVNVTITPYIHGDSVTLDNKIEISEVDNETNIGGIEQPIIGQRVVGPQTIDLQNGQSSVLAGIFEDSVIHNVTGVPGLDDVWGLGWLFATRHDETQHTELMIVMTPHIVRKLDLSRINLESIDTGTANNVTLRELPPATPASANGNAVSPSATGNAPAPAPAAPNPVPAGVAPGSPAAAPANGPATPRGSPLLQFSPAQSQATVGSQVTVAIQMTDVTNVFALACQLHYNPAVLQLVQVRDGGFLSGDAKTVALAHVEDATSGSSEITISRSPGAGGMSGGGTIAVVTFLAKAPGTSALTLSRMVARDPNGTIMPTQTESGGVVVH